MEIIRLQQEDYERYKAYCERWINAVDDSFLRGDELAKSVADLTFIARENEAIVGALSFVTNPYYERHQQARVRFFAAEQSLVMERLLEVALLHMTAKTMIFFVPAATKKLRTIVEALSFREKKVSAVMVNRRLATKKPIDWPMVPFITQRDEATYVRVRNEAFPYLSPIVESDVFQEDTKGIWFVERDGEVVGLVRLGEDGDEAYIAPIAVVPQAQRKGIGRALLRQALQQAYYLGYPLVYLSVDGANERAFQLYLAEGFALEQYFVCYEREIHP